MKKFTKSTIIISIFLIALVLQLNLGFSQDSKSPDFIQLENRYKCEDDLIEVMFVESSAVRMRNGEPTDLKSNATMGLNDVVGALAWHQWSRFCDVEETELDQWAANGERNTGQPVYNLNNIYTLKIPKGSDIWKVCQQMEDLPGIQQARPYPLPVEPPLPPNYQNNQGYLKQATLNPSGIDALYAWTQSGGTGAGITVCDLEYSWNYSHADITKAIGSSLNSWADPGFGNDHGTAVIGQLVADNNGWGITGICYGANLLTCGTYYPSGSPVWNVPGAMALAIANMTAGDIILLEQQWDYTGSSGYVPIEWWTNTNTPQTNNAVYAAIVNAVANGIHVVQAGGNGNINTGLLSWFGDSGAIIVGAGGATTTNDRQRLSFSSYGPRFNLQGWGQNVTTTGYGTLYSAEGVNYFYTSTFNGTSSASPIVAGAIACAQGYYVASVSATPPSPAFMRNHLVTYSQPQVFGTSGNIGPRPDLYQAIASFQPPQNNVDWGDAPDPAYPTLAVNNGARHIIDPTIYMGNSVDADPDGQPHPNANGDDNDGNDDEDGVFFTSIIMAGQTNTITIFASAPGFLNAWMDFNANGSWADPGEQVFTDVLLFPGPNNLFYNVPTVPFTITTYTRFRFSTQPGLTFSGQAPDGEVEDYEILINQAIQDEFDWGDAPDGPYPTLAANNGAHHFINPAIYLGYSIDGDPDGQPDPNAIGDDNDGNDDEDGVNFYYPLIPGQPATVDVIASGSFFLNAWIDQDFNGSWADPGDQIFSDVPLVSGVNSLSFIVGSPVGSSGNTFARFRFSSMTGLSFFGPAPDGEVEDFMIFIGDEAQDLYDWGDAPDSPYPTLSASNGAHHLIVPGIYLGTSIDGDSDGQPDPGALGDDNDGNDDEDGVTFNLPIIPGLASSIIVTASAPGFLNVWIDFGFNGSWADPGDHIFQDYLLMPGSNLLTFTAPLLGISGNTFARFRFSTLAGLSYTGPAPDGEVEDYMIFIGEETQDVLDWGDAPDGPYPTFGANNGAHHLIVPGLFLGYSIDAEPDGQPDPAALGDDNVGNDDEDGVVFYYPMLPGQAATVDVIASVPGLLNAWIDQDFNGSWADPGDHVFIDVPLSPGVNTLTFIASPGGWTGNTFARFRFSTIAGLSYIGPAPDGEVEDYVVFIGEETQDVFDWGDAPDSPYPTTASSNGPRHLIVPGIFLGNTIDAEIDGQPDPAALGDDNDGNDDEDGVNFNYPIIPGQPATIDVIASSPGFLNVWIDQDFNGSWADPGDHLFIDVPLNSGINSLTFIASPVGLTGNTFARFRFSTLAGLSYTGTAPDGEVEDYTVFFGEEVQDVFDFGDASDPTFPTLLVNNGARHIIDGVTFLGAGVDVDTDGQPNPNALGDDNDGNDDEDGVTVIFPLSPGGTAGFDINASVNGFLNAWIDFNGNGSWADAGEHIFVNQPLFAGSNWQLFSVPNNAQVGKTTARFRFSTVGGLNFDGLAPNGEVEDHELIIQGDVIVKLKVLLEGAYNGTEMTTDLNAGGVLPLYQPFNSDTSANWYYTGSESVSSIPNADITDWVLVEFRDAPSASSATGATVVSRQAAFLKKDGSVTGLNGTSPIMVNGVFQYQPYVVIWHRNHLGVLSANPLVNSGVNEYGYEFPTSSGQAFGGVLGHKNLGGGVWGMISADGEPDGVVDAADYLVWRKTLGTSGYDPADFNLDNQVDNQDKNDHWVPNIGKGSQVPN